MAAADAAASVEKVTVRYGRRLALDEVSLEVPEGTVTALLGRNGAGKSTLLRCLLGLERPAAGEVRVLGRDPWRARARLMREVGVVPEVPDAPLAETADGLARFLAAIDPAWDAEEFRSRLAQVPHRVAFASLSRGQRTQVMLAAALARRPRLLLLDDPTLGLDAVARRRVLAELVGELADRGTTVLLATHDLTGVEGIADRVAFLHEGRLLLESSLESLKTRVVRLGAGGPASLPAEWKVLAAGMGSGVVVQTPAVSVASGQTRPLSLEEIFIALCGDREAT